jgi:hypothetical protein
MKKSAPMNAIRVENGIPLRHLRCPRQAGQGVCSAAREIVKISGPIKLAPGLKPW